MPQAVDQEFVRVNRTDGSVVDIVWVKGGWITVPDSASLVSIPFEGAGQGQIVYREDNGTFYIATRIPETLDPITFDVIPQQFYWTELPFSGSFSGSFQGDGSQLTGIASSLYLSGSTGSDTINLKDDALTLTGSAGGIVVTVTDNKATFTIASPATISGSFTGDGSGLTGVVGVAGGTVNQLQYNSASAFGGAEIYYSSSGNLGIGVTNPSAKLVVDGDAIVTGKITAQEFHTEFVSASIIYQSGSTKFGDTADDNHIFTGTVNITGSVLAPRFSGSFSGSFQGDGSNLTGIASTLALSGSTGNDLVNLKTDALTITGSARNIDVAVTNNRATVSVSNNLTLSNVNLTGSFSGNFSGSVDAVITNAITASYVLNAVSASYAATASWAINAISASYVPGYVRDNGGLTNEVAVWSSADQISGSQGFFVSRSYGGNTSTFLDGTYYAQNNGAFVGLGPADVSGSRTAIGVYNAGSNGLIYAGSGSGLITAAIKLSTGPLFEAYAIGTSIVANKANTLRIEPTVELLAGITGSIFGSASYATSASYVDGYVRDGGGAADELAFWTNGDTISGSSLIKYNTGGATLNITGNVLATSFTGSFTGSFSGLISNAVSASYATTSLTASYFTGSHLDFTPLSNGDAPAYREGRVWYDADNGALAVYNDEADITLQVGQEFYVRVYNNSTSSIANGTPVYISGSQGDYPYIWPATAEDHTTGAHFDNHILGLATHDIEASSAGYVTRQGIVRNIDTTAFAAGDELFLQTGSAGLRNTPPPFPYDVVQVGFVIRSQANGFVLVDTKEPVHFSNISGLSGSGAAQNHDLWVYDGSNNAWYNTHSGLELSGSFSGSFYGPLVGTATTASYVKNAVSASYATYAATAGTATSASHALYANAAGTATSASHALVTNTATSASHALYANAAGTATLATTATTALTASSADSFLVRNSATINGDLTVGGIVTAQEFHTEFVSASIIFSSGSTIFGNTSDDLHQFTGSVDITNQLYAGLDNEVRAQVVGYNTTTGELTYFDSSSILATAIPGGSDNQVQYNNNGAMDGASGFVWDGTNVGIGTATPSQKLHVYQSATTSTSYVTVENNRTRNAAVFTKTTAGGFYTGTSIGTDTLCWQVYDAANGERIRIDASGSVGIGTTAPIHKLDVNGDARVRQALYLGEPNIASGHINAYEVMTFNIDVDNDDTDTRYFTWTKNGADGSGTQLMRLEETGSLVIGNISPSSRLYVYTDGVGTPWNGIGMDNGAQEHYWYLSDNTTSTFQIGSTAGSWQWINSNGTRLTIASTGKMTLGSYGSGTHTGTATKTLAVDSSGNVIELDVSSNGTGVANEVAVWKDTDTVSGSQALTWNGSTFYINGTLEATEKSFVIDHPTLPGKKLVYGVLEGPEHAVYCRGKISGEVIELPEEWTGLVDSESITVQLTPIGRHQNLYVVDVKDNKVFIKNGDLLTSKINAYYYIQATRKDVKALQTVRDK